MESQIEQRIIDQAIRLFKTVNPQDVSVSDICKASNITRPTFYKYFKNKDALFTYFYKYMGEIIEKEMVNMICEDSYVEQLWYIFDSFITYIEEFGANFISQLLIANLKESVMSFEIIDNLLGVATNLIEKALGAGQIRNTSDHAGLYVVLCRYYDGCVQYWCSQKGEPDVRKDVRKGFELILDIAPSYKKI
ncbi:MAG: TetR/AcrR family transcriptional regulator [Clostridia bacterium]|nr:TetR/AcrR family transcriptional regulator [Clostridia bacterium]